MRKNLSIRAKAFKALDNASALRSISSIRKTLIDAQKNAMLATDDLEDMLYSEAPSMEMATQVGPAIESAVDVVKKIEEHIKAAIDLSNEAKSILRIDPSADEAMQTEAPIEEPVRYYGYSRRNFNNLKARRENARKRLARRRGY